MRPYKLMEQSASEMEAFSNLGEAENIEADTIEKIEQFVCSMYGRPRLTSVNDVRLALFNQNYASRDTSKPMEKIKGVDASSLPQCKATLIEKMKLANFVSSVWKHANTANPMLFSPEGHGWCIENSAHKLIWFRGNQMP